MLQLMLAPVYTGKKILFKKARDSIVLSGTY